MLGMNAGKGTLYPDGAVDDELSQIGKKGAVDGRKALGDSEGLEFTTSQHIFLFKIAQCTNQPVSFPFKSSRSLHSNACMIVHFCIRTMVTEEGSRALCTPGLGTNATFAPENPERSETILYFIVNQFAIFLQPIHGLDRRLSPQGKQHVQASEGSSSEPVL